MDTLCIIGPGLVENAGFFTSYLVFLCNDEELSWNSMFVWCVHKILIPAVMQSILMAS